MLKVRGRMNGEEITVTWLGGVITTVEGGLVDREFMQRLIAADMEVARKAGETSASMYLQAADMAMNEPIAVCVMLGRRLEDMKIIDGDLGLEPTPDGAVN